MNGERDAQHGIDEPATVEDSRDPSGVRRRWVPWQGRPARADTVLIGAILGVLLIGVASRPIQPFLIASNPVVLEFLTGDLAAIGAAAAFARIGHVPLWLVVTAGVVGMIKLDWLTWWAGRQWGDGIIRMFTTSGRTHRWARQRAMAHPRVVRVAVVLATLPGVPTAVVFALAGMTGMRLTTFLLLDLLGALAMTGLVAGVGYGLGQHAVDLVLLIDRHASVVSLAVIGLAVAVPLVKTLLRRWRRQRTR